MSQVSDRFDHFRTGSGNDLPKKTNWAQKSTTPKNGKLSVTRFRNVLTTLGVQTFLAAGLLANSEHGRIWLV